MPISQRRFVDIASAVVGGTAVPLQKLVARVFTASQRVPTQNVLSFYSAPEVLNFFGEGVESSFAAKYYAYTSPAPVSRAKEIQFAAHLTSSRAMTLTGNDKVAPTETLAGLSSPTMVIVTTDLDKNEQSSVTITPELTDAVSYQDVADALTAAVTSDLPSVSFGYQVNPQGVGEFSLTYASAGNIEVAVEAGELTRALGMSVSVFDVGGSQQTMTQAYAASIDVSDSFGSAYFLTQSDDVDQLVSVAEMNAAENVKHQLYIGATRAQYQAFSTALIGTASVGLILKTFNNDQLAAIPMAIMAATDYDRTNATTNYMFRQSGVTLAPQVTNSTDADLFDKARVNYYGETASAGAKISFFQRAFLCGSANAPQDMSVHANEQWLKAYIAQQWFSLLLSTRGVPANLDGRAQGLIVIADAVSKALDNGTILSGKTLTPAQIIAIGDASGDDLAFHDVADKGYWYDVEIVENTGPSGIAEYVLKYVLIYGKGDWIRKVEGSHNLV